MGELRQQLEEFLGRTAITLEEPVTIGRILLLIGVVVVSFFIAGFLRRWSRRLFNRLRIQENTQNRLLAILFLTVIIVGIVVAFNVAGISTGLFGRIFNFPLADLFQPSQKPTESPTGISSLFQTLLGRKPAVVDDGARRLTLARLFYGFAIIFGMYVLSKYAQWVLQQQVLQAFQIQRHTRFIILRFFHFTIIALGVLISLRTIGVSFTSLAIIFGGLSIGIGFGLQNVVSNLISGLILIFERPIKIGDLVEIIDVNIFGRVTSINLRSTVIMALDEKEIIVPNSQLITEPVHNLTHYNARFRVRVQVGVSYGSDVELVKKVLLEVAHAHPEVIKEPTPEMEDVSAPFVRFTNFGESSLDFELFAWIPDSFERFDVASDLHFMIWEKFKEYDIKIPFPQRDVHFYPEER
ncbi:MAG: mechanosensitive ion channel [Candidatus Poribacteria bacterium]|nr:mechanosensitive ion channel [Candidatus Poribacteria bacterium]